MLRVTALAEYDGEIEWNSDEYALPVFSVRVGKLSSESTAAWTVEPLRPALAESSLLEVYVHCSDGSLRNIGLIGIRTEWIEFVDDDYEFLSEGVRGIPLVDTKLWEDAGVEMRKGTQRPMITEGMPLRLFVGQSAYSLQIGEATETSEVVAFDQFRLGLDRDRNLRRIDVVGVSPAKIQGIEHYRRSPPGGIPPMRPGLLPRLWFEIGILLRRLRWAWLLYRSR